MAQSEVFLSSRQVRKRYGNASDMWLWRRENEEGSTFPKPFGYTGAGFGS
jgi:predicted DNA-binding transcriptional regulator AlpA